MTTPSMNYNPRPRTQADRRRTYPVLDQHGRQWVVNMEIASGGIVGAPIPCFTDTLRTPSQYCVVPFDNPRIMEINYDQWIADLKNRWEEWNTHRVEVTRSLYGDRAEIDRPPSREVLSIVGPAPLDAAVIEAAKQGDVPGLGTEEPDEAPSATLAAQRARDAKRARKEPT